MVMPRNQNHQQGYNITAVNVTVSSKMCQRKCLGTRTEDDRETERKVNLRIIS